MWAPPTTLRGGQLPGHKWRVWCHARGLRAHCSCFQVLLLGWRLVYNRRFVAGLPLRSIFPTGGLIAPSRLMITM